VKKKDQHWLVGSMLLDSDYFKDDATHIVKDFWRRFRMNKELFMRILFGIREYEKLQREVFWDARDNRLHTLGWKNCLFTSQILYKGHTEEYN
jgi:hypothetical protein